jgi:hypothetical protein
MSENAETGKEDRQSPSGWSPRASGAVARQKVFLSARASCDLKNLFATVTLTETSNGTKMLTFRPPLSVESTSATSKMQHASFRIN